MAVIGGIIAVALAIFGLLDLIFIMVEIFGRKPVDRQDAIEWRLLRRRRIVIHLAVYVLIILGFWAIIHFGPLRPVHEWLR